MDSIQLGQLLDEQHLRRALHEATGQGVTVALLDTGVDVTHPDLENVVTDSVEVMTQQRRVFSRKLPVERLTGKQLDPAGHGTACAGIIHRLAPEAKIISVRVIGTSAQGTGEQFVHGLRWVLEQTEMNIKAVNLSLGTTHKRFAGPLLDLVDQAYYQGIVLVAAGNNFPGTSYPSEFSSLIAVDNEQFDDPLEFEYRGGQPIEFAASGIYVEAPMSGGGHRKWTGTSFACPHVTALVARLLSIDLTLTPFQVKTLLHALRRRSEDRHSEQAGQVNTQEPEGS